MGQNDSFQIRAEEDGCLYIFSLALGKWQKVCDNVLLKDVPKSVWDGLRLSSIPIKDVPEEALKALLDVAYKKEK
jgi:hypothetical protein